MNRPSDPILIFLVSVIFCTFSHPIIVLIMHILVPCGMHTTGILPAYQGGSPPNPMQYESYAVLPRAL